MATHFGSPRALVHGLRPRRAFALMVGVCLASSAFAEELPTTLRASMLVRVLAYDRRMGQQPPPLTLAVIHREGDVSSEDQGRELSGALETVSRGRVIAGRPLRVVRIGFTDTLQFQEKLSQERAVALYVCDGLEGDSERIAQVTRRLSVLSIAGSEAQVNHGLAIGLSRKGNSPVILVHLSAARAEGADLDAGLLSLSRLVEPEKEVH
ncbi:YfiR family protein [Hyalangium rubrum]|uniref:YfiR family protein n=1 Tax=Hyalangium rubrum TaxID=3103134 RepID=A0ABU5GW36_9BACT|nr:YfiR family protein [Hyalangium sp. s54d21]MDY7225395.1 YfiR family protein [Hyalangium sp. s54d21]